MQSCEVEIVRSFCFRRRRLKNGEFKDCDRYTGTGAGPCHNYLPEQWITSMRWPSPLRKDAQ